MINNRQNGRRRGRGGGPRSPNVPSPGNRQDNRSRGNASQLHEKYKALARDAQLAGDRVQTENYLQFADHYFRVLNENRARFEEQRPRRDDFNGYDDEESDEALSAVENDEGGERSEREQRPQREARGDRVSRAPRDDQHEPRNEGVARSERGERAPRPRREDPRTEGEVRADRGDREQSEERAEREPRAPRRGRPRRDAEAGEPGEERISVESLPPAIASAAADPAEGPKPVRRRTRRAAAPDGGEEIAPAA